MLFRGESLQTHTKQGGAILPKGTEMRIHARHDGSARYDGKFTYGESEENAVRAQHIEGGKWNNCFVSTTRSLDRARHFATSGNLDEGVIYSIDESLCERHGVVLVEVPDPQYPNEMEVSIRAADGGEIPQAVVVSIERVSPR
ncbi:hypothetical protein [Achromobacter xylosoxidans]|uniref:hypothetical protein n=1 Tax=Alcaligenes xylosoxydans xylosoxydans TaxID=85698 RepID=UPI001EEA5E6F|nr:hypothetical protein [Achromobacter xylosoxidans]